MFGLGGATRLAQVVDICHPNINKSISFSTNLFKLPQRCLSNTSKPNNETGADTKLNKPSTTVEKTWVPNDLKDAQPKATIAGSEKVW